MYVTPGIVVDGELITTNLVDINLGIRILLGSSYYQDWENSETLSLTIPLAIPSTNDIRGIRQPFRIRSDATSVENTHGSCRRGGMTTARAIISRLIRGAGHRAPVGDRTRELVDIGYVKATGKA